jgi:hypothetical protein
MVGPWGLEPQTSTVSTRGHQVLTTTYKAVGDCQVLDNTPWSDTSRVGLRVEFRENCWATVPPTLPCSTASSTTAARVIREINIALNAGVASRSTEANEMACLSSDILVCLLYVPLLSYPKKTLSCRSSIQTNSPSAENTGQASDRKNSAASRKPFWDQKFNLYLRYDLSPMCQGRTPGFMERAMESNPPAMWK